jgi:glycosyltransferase involved in cell wall biosynthesis
LAYAVPKCLRVLVVNEGAIPRIRKYSEDVEICVVPLCCDFEFSGATEEGFKEGAISFVYVGTFDPLRRLDIVLQAFASVAARRNFVVDFIGGEREALCLDETTAVAIDLLQKKGMLNFWPKLPRAEVRERIASADVGVNLIPPLDVYRESSSTKLGEYLSQGIPVISSLGIPYHHQIHGFGDVGWLVLFDASSLGSAIEGAIDLGRERLASYREACLKVVGERLRYEAYVDTIIS